MKNHTSPRHPQLPLRAPEPTPEQCAAFTSWYAARFGVVLDPKEASARFRYFAELFLLLGGADWIGARAKTARKST